ncbi:MAG: class A beta-lactamase-related serine hydrolase [Verrucomicrobiaceae bacterium]|nr:MAG: class A beta-lactamase-related serine hydrolase [Verrucomicrobiaceae bacterium]
MTTTQTGEIKTGFVDQGVLPGAVALVQRGDDVQVATIGMRDLANNVPMKEDDLFWIASMTKPMAAICVAMLVEEGKMSFDDPVEKHLPEFRGQWLVSEDGKEKRVLTRPARPITIRDLMTHTAGLGEVPSPRPDSTLAELTMGYAREALRFPPGSKWSYSNPGINTLGRLVEVGSGKPFAEFLQQRLLDPLGMTDTTFWPTAEQAQRLAKSYGPGEGGKLKEVEVYFIKGPLSDRKRTPYPAGGLFSTARDVAKLYRMMLADGAVDGHTYLKKETVAEMTTTQTGEIKTGFVDGMSWGLGFQVVKEPKGVTAALSSGTFGHGGAYGTQSWADPKRGLIYVLMIQRAGLPNGDASEMRRVMQEVGAQAAE